MIEITPALAEAFAYEIEEGDGHMTLEELLSTTFDEAEELIPPYVDPITRVMIGYVEWSGGPLRVPEWRERWEDDHPDELPSIIGGALRYDVEQTLDAQHALVSAGREKGPEEEAEFHLAHTLARLSLPYVDWKAVGQFALDYADLQLKGQR